MNKTLVTLFLSVSTALSATFTQERMIKTFFPIIEFSFNPVERDIAFKQQLPNPNLYSNGYANLDDKNDFCFYGALAHAHTNNPEISICTKEHYAVDGSLLASYKHQQSSQEHLLTIKKKSSKKIVLDEKIQHFNNDVSASCMVFSSDKSMFALGFTDGNIFVWDLKQSDKSFMMLSSHKNALIALAFQKDTSILLSLDSDGLAMKTDLLDKNEPKKLFNLNQTLLCGAISSREDFLFVSAKNDVNSKIMQWDLKAKQAILRAEHDAKVNCLLYLENDNRIISGSNDRSICIWKLKE